MLFDHSRTERNARHGRPDAERMIRQPDIAAKQRLHMRDCEDVRPCGRCRIAACTFEQGDVAASIFACRPHELIQIRNGRHPRRDNERLPRPRHLADERQIGILERCDLIARCAQFFEKINCRHVKRGAKTDKAVLPRTGKDLLLPRPRCMRLLIELVE